jgi:DNA-binding phage protein
MPSKVNIAPFDTPFDLAEYLTTSKIQDALLADALESGDAGYIRNVHESIVRVRLVAEKSRSKK